MAPVVLAADLGAGSLRVALVAFDGAIVSQTVGQHPAHIADDRHEANADAWWAAFCQAAHALLRDAQEARARVEAIAITAMTRSTVFLDANGRVAHPAVLWRDLRAGPMAKRLAQSTRETNPAFAINAFHPLAKLAWLKRTQPALFETVTAALEPKDFLNLRLTGALATDTVVAARTAKLEAAPSDELRPFIQRMPADHRDPVSVLGTVRRGVGLDGLAGVPVLASSMDAWAATVGAGAVEPGRAYDVSGTSEVAGLFAPVPADAPGLLSIRWTAQLYHVGGPTQAGGEAVSWAHETFGVDGALSVAVERAAARAVGLGAPVVLPYLAGERAPVWRSDVRAMVSNLSDTTHPDEVLRAAMEGVGFAVRDILTTAEEATGVKAQVVHICGGGAHSDGWCQLRADALGRPFARPREVECGLIGAAIAAGVAIGQFASLADGAGAMNPVSRVFAPRADEAEVAARRWRAYQRLKAFALAEADAIKA